MKKIYLLAYLAVIGISLQINALTDEEILNTTMQEIKNAVAKNTSKKPEKTTINKTELDQALKEIADKAGSELSSKQAEPLKNKIVQRIQIVKNMAELLAFKPFAPEPTTFFQPHVTIEFSDLLGFFNPENNPNVGDIFKAEIAKYIEPAKKVFLGQNLDPLLDENSPFLSLNKKMFSQERKNTPFDKYINKEAGFLKTNAAITQGYYNIAKRLTDAKNKEALESLKKDLEKTFDNNIQKISFSEWIGGNDGFLSSEYLGNKIDQAIKKLENPSTQPVIPAQPQEPTINKDSTEKEITDYIKETLKNQSKIINVNSLKETIESLNERISEDDFEEVGKDSQGAQYLKTTLNHILQAINFFPQADGEINLTQAVQDINNEYNSKKYPQATNLTDLIQYDAKRAANLLQGNLETKFPEDSPLDPKYKDATLKYLALTNDLDNAKTRAELTTLNLKLLDTFNEEQRKLLEDFSGAQYLGTLIRNKIKQLPPEIKPITNETFNSNITDALSKAQKEQVINVKQLVDDLNSIQDQIKAQTNLDTAAEQHLVNRIKQINHALAILDPQQNNTNSAYEISLKTIDDKIETFLKLKNTQGAIPSLNSLALNAYTALQKAREIIQDKRTDIKLEEQTPLDQKTKAVPNFTPIADFAALTNKYLEYAQEAEKTTNKATLTSIMTKIRDNLYPIYDRLSETAQQKFVQWNGGNNKQDAIETLIEQIDIKYDSIAPTADYFKTKIQNAYDTIVALDKSNTTINIKDFVINLQQLKKEIKESNIVDKEELLDNIDSKLHAVEILSDLNASGTLNLDVRNKQIESFKKIAELNDARAPLLKTIIDNLEKAVAIISDSNTTEILPLNTPLDSAKNAERITEQKRTNFYGATSIYLAILKLIYSANALEELTSTERYITKFNEIFSGLPNDQQMIFTKWINRGNGLIPPYTIFNQSLISRKKEITPALPQKPISPIQPAKPVDPKILVPSLQTLESNLSALKAQIA